MRVVLTSDAAPVPTGVPGLDPILRGGYPANRIHLIEGRPGSGKTTLGLQFLLDGLKHGESGLYITLSETKRELHAVAATHGWSLGGLRGRRSGSSSTAFGRSACCRKARCATAGRSSR